MKLFTLTLLALSFGTAIEFSAVKSSEPTLVGTWDVIAVQESGVFQTPATLAAQNLKVVVTEDTITIGNGKRASKYKLVETETQNQIHLTYDSKITRAAYKLDGNVLRVYASQKAPSVVPTKLESTAKSQNIVFILQRVSEKVAQIDGDWQAESYTVNGENLVGFTNLRVEVQRAVNQVVLKWYTGPKGDQEMVTVYETNSKHPTWLDNDNQRGVFKVDGDSMIICFGDKRPASTATANNVSRIVLKRVR